MLQCWRKFHSLLRMKDERFHENYISFGTCWCNLPKPCQCIWQFFPHICHSKWFYAMCVIVLKVILFSVIILSVEAPKIWKGGREEGENVWPKLWNNNELKFWNFSNEKHKNKRLARNEDKMFSDHPTLLFLKCLQNGLVSSAKINEVDKFFSAT